jgi:hypothetical protein
VSLGSSAGGCAANIIDSTGFRRVALPTGISCSRDPVAIDNLVLTSGPAGVIALH